MKFIEWNENKLKCLNGAGGAAQFINHKTKQIKFNLLIVLLVCELMAEQLGERQRSSLFAEIKNKI